MRGKNIGPNKGKHPSLRKNSLFIALKLGERGNDGLEKKKRSKGAATKNELLQRLDSVNVAGKRASQSTLAKKGLEKRAKALPKGNALAVALGMSGSGNKKNGIRIKNSRINNKGDLARLKG